MIGRGRSGRVASTGSLRTRRDDTGATTLEFTLVFLFVLMPAMLATLQYGYQYWALQTASATAREAARRLAVGTSPACARTEAQGNASGPAIGAVTVTYSPDYSTTTQPRIGQVVTVTVAYDSLNMRIPFLPLPSGGRISESAEARVQRVRVGSTTDPFLRLNGTTQTSAGVC